MPSSRESSQPRDNLCLFRFLHWQMGSLPLVPPGNLGDPKCHHKWVKVTQSCRTLCDPVDYTVHGVLQARLLEWVAFPFSKGSSHPESKPRWWNLYQLSHKGSPEFWSGYPISSPADLPDPGIELESPALEADSLPTELSGKPKEWINIFQYHEEKL